MRLVWASKFATTLCLSLSSATLEALGPRAGGLVLHATLDAREVLLVLIDDRELFLEVHLRPAFGCVIHNIVVLTKHLRKFTCTTE